MKKINCFNCGKAFEGGVPGKDIGFPVTIQNIETGEEYEEIVCLKCAAVINKESGGAYLGIESLDEIDWSHYIADCDDPDCDEDHEAEKLAS